MKVRLWDFLFYAAFALIVVSFVRLAGVLLTFAYLIVPAVCGVMLAKNWLGRLLVGWGIAATASLLGLWFSYRLDLPTGAAIVVVCGLFLVLISVIASLRRAWCFSGPGLAPVPRHGAAARDAALTRRRTAGPAPPRPVAR